MSATLAGHCDVCREHRETTKADAGLPYEWCEECAALYGPRLVIGPRWRLRAVNALRMLGRAALLFAAVSVLYFLQPQDGSALTWRQGLLNLVGILVGVAGAFYLLLSLLYLFFGRGPTWRRPEEDLTWRPVRLSRPVRVGAGRKDFYVYECKRCRNTVWSAAGIPGERELFKCSQCGSLMKAPKGLSGKPTGAAGRVVRGRLIEAAVMVLAAITFSAVGYHLWSARRLAKDYEAWVGKGQYYSTQEENYDGAIDAFNRAINLDPGRSDAYEGRATVYLMTKQNDRAVADATRAIQLNPKGGLAYWVRGIARLRQDQPQEAVEDLTLCLGYAPDSLKAQAHGDRAVAYISARDYEKAVADATEAVRLSPASDLAYYYRGVAHLGEKNYDEALADFTSASQHGTDSRYDAGIAAAHAGLGDFRDAVSWQEQAIPLASADKAQEAKLREVRTLYQEGKVPGDELLRETLPCSLYSPAVATPVQKSESRVSDSRP